MYLLKKNLWILSPIFGRFVVGWWNADECKSRRNWKSEVRIRCPRDENMGRKFWVAVKRYALRISSPLGEGEMDKRDVSKERKVVPEDCRHIACIYSDRADGTWESSWPVDVWHSYKQLLLCDKDNLRSRAEDHVDAKCALSTHFLRSATFHAILSQLLGAYPLLFFLYRAWRTTNEGIGGKSEEFK